MLDVIEDLQGFSDYSIDSTHPDFEHICLLIGEGLRVLNVTASELYENVLMNNVISSALTELVEDTPALYEDLCVVQNLEMLYEQLRLMKLEGKVYDVLDDFFNRQLNRTL